jgi:hypothetical protein
MSKTIILKEVEKVSPNLKVINNILRVGLKKIINKEIH